MSAAALTDLIGYLDGSPSPWHAVASSVARLQATGFTPVGLTAPWVDVPAQGYVVRDGALVAWSRGAGTEPTTPVRLVGAHTDSPGLHVKPRPDTGAAGWKQIAVEVYGGALLNSWLDRDLGIAGHLALTDGSTALVRVHTPVARVPQLAIHLDRDVNEKGLLLDKQQHLTPVWGLGAPRDGEFREWLAQQAGVQAVEVAAWDLCLYDLTPGAILGRDGDLLAAGRLDNQLSCWAATSAICAAAPSDDATAVIALFDHEEVGSESTTGAAGPLLEHVLERLALATGATRAQYLAQLAASTCFSCDNAHSVHPNYPERHEPGHRPLVNQGPAIKLNHNQRYATSAQSAAMAQRVFQAAGVPWQVFVSRNNMPCGSTIGPITATRLGIATVDVGVPQLSMHSARELCGTQDPLWLADGLAAWFAGA
ncbi:MAG: M18 family aminopeptidase [Actinomycetota bacterium]|nr:M18 family aminopeptidase [Actinomycetota bacterium]